MKLEFLLGLLALTEPVIRDAEPIVRLAQLRLDLYCLGVEPNRLLIIMLRGREDAELEVSIETLWIERDGF